jgi:cell division protein ZapA
MKNEVIPVSVTILGKEYKIACTEEGRPELLNSAKRLDNEMREIRDSGKINGPDRIAVIAALNLAHETTVAKKQNYSPTNENLSSQLTHLRQKIEMALEKYA